MSEPTTRRDFLIGAAGVTALTAAGCGGADPTVVDDNPAGDATNFATSDRPPTVPATGTDAAACAAGSSGFASGILAADVGLNQAKKVTTPAPNLNLYVCRDSQGLVGVDVTCTHLGCKPNYVNEQAIFSCPCHGSQYSVTGALLKGPAPLPLPRFAACKSSDGTVHIDISKPLP